MKLFTSFDSTKIWYNYIKGKKTCLVFLHGLSGSSSAWDPISTYFEKKGYSILLVDTRGNGLSDKPVDKSKYTIKNASEDLYLLLKHLKIKEVILIGHCHGGIISQFFYDNHPNYVKKMILISTSYGFSQKGFRHLLSFIVYLIYSLFSILSYPLHFEKNKKHLDYTKFGKGSDLNLIRIYNDMSATSFPVFLAFFREAMFLDISEKTKKINVPVLIIHGKKDLISQVKTAYEMNKLIKNSRLCILNTNHISVFNAIQEIIKEIDTFLEL